MKNRIAKAVAAGMIAAVAGTAAAETSVTLDFASAYVYRGYTLNDEAVFQPGIEASGLGLPEQIGTFTIGAWGNYDFGDYGGAVTPNQFSEIDWYASYAAPIEVVDLSVGVTDYTYPAGSAEDVELFVGLGYELAGVGLAATVYRGVSGDILGGVTTVEFGVDYGIDFTETLSGSLAADARYVDGQKSGYGWNDGTVSAGVAYALNEAWSIYGSATYIAQLDDTVLVDGPFAYDVDFLGTVGVSTTF
ncbi:MAG: hypothetical protein U9P12_07115 [Verrucomicrobiota bacterium]|nr:hypothetical protein [Verrucomicrobiota bacterium]